MKLKGEKELLAILKKIPKELDIAVENQLEISAQEIERDAKSFAPVDTGKLRQSIKTEKIDSKSWVIKANQTGLATYAPFVEYGTRFQKAQPFLFPAFFKGVNRFTNDLEDLLEKVFKK